jgi:hypothetical protein
VLDCGTTPRMWMARPFQTRSRHRDVGESERTEVTKEGCTAPGWSTEQGKTLALGSGRISCQNPEVPQRSVHPHLKHLANAFLSFAATNTQPPHTSHTTHSTHPTLHRHTRLWCFCLSVYLSVHCTTSTGAPSCLFVCSIDCLFAAALKDGVLDAGPSEQAAVGTLERCVVPG